MRSIVMLGLIAILGWTGAATLIDNYEARSEGSLGGSSGEAAEDRFVWRGRIAPGLAIEIKGINGYIRAEPGTGDEVEVLATKRGRRSDPREVDIQVHEHGKGITVCAVYPSDNPNLPNECLPGKQGRSNVSNNDVQVNFLVRVPPGVRFIGRTVNGKVEADSLLSNVQAHTVNGSIRIFTAGYAEATTVNGSIKAALGTADWNEPLRFQTVNGSIALDLPPDTSADVEAETLNGEVSSDFPITVRGRVSARRIAGIIGSGGRRLNLKTVNGSIRLRIASY